MTQAMTRIVDAVAGTKTVAVVGATGAVGAEMLRCLEHSSYPTGTLNAFASERSASIIWISGFVTGSRGTPSLSRSSRDVMSRVSSMLSVRGRAGSPLVTTSSSGRELPAGGGSPLPRRCGVGSGK